MREKSIFARIFGSGERTPRVNPVSEMASQNLADAMCEAYNKAEERRKLETIARLRGSEQLPKQVEEIFRECVSINFAYILIKHGMYIRIVKCNEYADLLWPVFKAHLLSGDGWLERADARDKSPITEREKLFFEKGGAE